MTLIEALNWRYACKKFDSTKKLSKEQVDTIIQAINLSPTSKGLQPYKFIVIENANTKKKLFEATHFQQQVIDCSHLIVICREKNIDKQLIDDFFNRTVKLRNLDKLAPHIQKFAAGLNTTLDLDEDTLSSWIKNQIYLVMGTLMTSCAVLQIDACPMEGFDVDKYEKELDLAKKDLTPVLLCPVGYRHKDDVFQDFAKVRRPLSEMVIKID